MAPHMRLIYELLFGRTDTEPPEADQSRATDEDDQNPLGDHRLLAQAIEDDEKTRRLLAIAAFRESADREKISTAAREKRRMVVTDARERRKTVLTVTMCLVALVVGAYLVWHALPALKLRVGRLVGMPLAVGGASLVTALTGWLRSSLLRRRAANAVRPPAGHAENDHDHAGAP